MKFNSTFFSSLLIVSASQLTLNANAWAAKEAKPERWFEIEVILFKQLNDKAALKEQFPDNLNATKLPHYKQSFDLLNPYLQPSLSRIKQFTPLCGEKDEQHQYLDSLQSVSLPFPEQMQLIEQVAIFEMPNFSEDTEAIDETAVDNTQALTDENSINEVNTDEVNISEVDTNKDDPITENTQLNNVSTILAPSDGDSANNALVEVSQSDEVTFTYDLQKEELAQAIFSTQNICVITQHEIESLFNEEQLANFNLDAFDITDLPTKLNASGAHVSDSPYLIADDSLLLKDISQALRWSKEFRPLLHFGWRQVGITKNKAIPLKLFAGKHLAHEYKQALTDYHTEIAAAKAIEQNLFEQLAQAQDTAQTSDQTFSDEVDNKELTNSTNIDTIDNELTVKVEHKQQKLNELFSTIDNNENSPIADDAIDSIINSVDKQSLEELLSSNHMELAIDEQMLDNSLPPKEPLQPWFLDGFIKVHLDHYLYITADFNVFNQDQVKIQTETDENNDINLINFSQNRQVISGEIHYFDHPYIGMIVQIRRFDPTKPADEAVTQVIK